MERGEVWRVELDPREGLGGSRRGLVVVVSSQEFNSAMPCALVVPVAEGSHARGREGFTVGLAVDGSGSGGVVLCDGIRAMDVRARDGRHVQTLADDVTGEIVARVAAILR